MRRFIRVVGMCGAKDPPPFFSPKICDNFAFTKILAIFLLFDQIWRSFRFLTLKNKKSFRFLGLKNAIFSLFTQPILQFFRFFSPAAHPPPGHRPSTPPPRGRPISNDSTVLCNLVLILLFSCYISPF